MPWIEATLRGERVLARANEDGSLVSDRGRVEIRYKPTDRRAYRASAQNLEVADGARLLDDASCIDAATAIGPTTSHRSVAPDAWVAYTDGACSGNPGPAGCGVVLVGPDGKFHEGLEYLGQATNNVAELTGILRALEWVPASARSIVVHTDSQYAIGVLQKGWKAKANQELVQRTKRAVQARSARLVYVPGHQGVPLNERADQLAREAVQARQSRVAQTPGTNGTTPPAKV
jgi:ribonuclease HI